jgi:hypothetical protein
MVMKSGQRVAIPREEIQVLASAPRKQVAEVKIENFGTALHWPRLDLDLSVEGLLKGVTGNRRWMQELKLQRRRSRQVRSLSGSPPLGASIQAR